MKRKEAVNIEEDIAKKLSELEEERDDLSCEVRQVTLRMAKMWNGKGHIHEAMDLYKKIIKRYKDSIEAKEAKSTLMSYAKRFESEGHYHLAQALYEELLL